MILVVSLLSLGYIWAVYDSKKQVRTQLLQSQGKRIEREINNSFDYVTNFLKFMGDNVLSGSPEDLERILGILRGRLVTNESLRRQFSWDMFDWSTEDKKIIATTSYGIVKEPIDISYRNYANMAPQKPWMLHFDKTDVGITSGQWIIPAGMGISDDKGNFIGTISLGFNVASLNRNIETVLNAEKTSFVVLDNDLSVALYSADNKINEANKDFFQGKITLDNKPLFNGKFIKPVEYGDVLYSYYLKLDNYPYTILVGQNKNIAYSEMKEILLPGIIGYIIIAVTSLLLLLILRILVIKPVVKLSKVADDISQNKDFEKTEFGYSYEIRNLAKQLLYLKRSIKREQRAKNKNNELIEIIKNSDKEKEIFLKEMNLSLKENLDIINKGVEIMSQEAMGSLDIKTYGGCLNEMNNASKNLENYTSNYLIPTTTDIANLVERCVIIKKRYAFESKVKITSNIAADIPKLLVDSLKLRQVILSTMFHSISYTLPGGESKISSFYDYEKQELVIKVSDNGLGLNEQQRFKFWESQKTNPTSYTNNLEYDRVPIRVIRNIVELHNGTFILEGNERKGSEFTITIPYLSKGEIENNNKASFSGTTSKNIVKFPVRS